jgi:ubiquinone/menaquinone biosynthesis C-methylase UbiE
MTDVWDGIWKNFEFEKGYKDAADSIDAHYFMKDYFTGRRGQKILEVGCGTGLTALILAEKYGLRPYLLDASLESVRICKRHAKRLKIKAIVVKAYAQKLPFPDGYFDICLSGGLLEHLSAADRLKTLQEMCRVSKDLIVVTVPNAHNIPYRIGKFWREALGKWIYGREDPLSRSELRQLMKKCNTDVDYYQIFGMKFKESLAWSLPRTDRFSKYLRGKSVLDNFGCELVLVIKKSKQKRSKKAST